MDERLRSSFHGSSRSSPVESGPHASAPYDNRFFDVVDRASLSSAEAVVPLVRDLVPARTVVDVGCGRGAWLRTFKAHGAETISGYDGAYVDPAKLLIPRDAFTAVDLSAPLTITAATISRCASRSENISRSAARGLWSRHCVSSLPRFFFRRRSRSGRDTSHQRAVAALLGAPVRGTRVRAAGSHSPSRLL